MSLPPLRSRDVDLFILDMNLLFAFANPVNYLFLLPLRRNAFTRMIFCHAGEFCAAWLSCCAFLGCASAKWSIVNQSGEADKVSASCVDGPELWLCLSCWHSATRLARLPFLQTPASFGSGLICYCLFSWKQVLWKFLLRPIYRCFLWGKYFFLWQYLPLV